MKIDFVKGIKGKNLVFCVDGTIQSNKFFKKIDQELDGFLSTIIKNSSFKGKQDEIFASFVPKKYNKILFIGIGATNNFSDLNATKLGGKILTILKAQKLESADIIAPKHTSDIAFGIYLKDYSFNKYKSSDKLKKIVNIKSLNFISNDNQKDKDAYTKYAHIAQSIHFARDLITEPPNIIYPESIANEVKNNFSAFKKAKVEILGLKELQKLGMGALIGVAQGSVREPKLVVIEYKGGKKDEKPIAFIGKGVTFDSGGLSIKLSGMEDMKYDMAGSAIVIGTMRALIARNAKVNAVGILGFVENMVDGNAQRPSDVVKSMSGQTIEVLNTDAEGRLVLCDALWYCQDRFKPKFMIDIATLTGAISIALGSEYAGLFSNNQNLSDKLYKSSIKTDEKLWAFPMHENYDKELISDIADMRNIAISARAGGSIVAAKFLQKFVNKTPWAHLDIANVAWDKKGNDFHPKGATGFGIRLLNQFVEDFCENK